MRVFFDRKTSGFLTDELHASIPADAVEITVEKWRELLDGQAKGKIIGADADGSPALLDPPAPDEDQVRAMRASAYRNESDPLRFEADYDAMTSGNEPDYTAWLAKVAEIKARFPLPEQ